MEKMKKGVTPQISLRGENQKREIVETDLLAHPDNAHTENSSDQSKNIRGPHEKSDTPFGAEFVETDLHLLPPDTAHTENSVGRSESIQGPRENSDTPERTHGAGDSHRFSETGHTSKIKRPFGDTR